MKGNELLTMGQVAELIGVSRAQTVQDLVARGDLPAPIRLGPRLPRWRRATLLAFFEQRDPNIILSEEGFELKLSPKRGRPRSDS